MVVSRRGGAGLKNEKKPIFAKVLARTWSALERIRKSANRVDGRVEKWFVVLWCSPGALVLYCTVVAGARASTANKGR